MLTREEVIEMLKDAYNNNLEDFNINELSTDELKDLVIKGYMPHSQIAEYNKLSINARNIVNNKIKENFEIFDGELTTERDKCATILTAMDDMIGNKTFRNSKKQIDSEVGEKGINSIAEEVTGDINYQIRKEIQKNNERIVNLEARNTKLREILNVIDLYNNKKESADIIFENIEDFFALFDISEIKENKGLQKVINKYIDLNKQINRRPSAIGQKFIDEYNRIKH